ncbi:MAG: hypothetical protein HZB38_02750, partial [Planctomycetes bacterium]|nr:hypothetical protein [Planctomycetota bacterium]
MKKCASVSRFAVGGGLALLSTLTAASTSAAGIEVIFSKKPGHATANIPGTLDLSGLPAASDWKAIEDFSVSPDGRRWMVKGRTQLGADLETVMVLGGGSTGTMFAQEGQPFIGGSAGELYDFFDTPSPVSFDTLGGFVFSARAKGGVTSDDEKVISVDSGGVQTLLLKQGDPALGLQDVPANPTGDELFGNSIGSVTALETADRVMFVNTPITNCHSTRYPASFRGNSAFRQSGVSVIGGEIWDTFDLSESGGTPDAAHWYSEGDTENTNTAIDKILVVDDTVMIREGSPVGGAGNPVMADIFENKMASDGTWVSRGDDPLDNDWAVRSGVLVAKTGDPITTGASELWGAVFSSIAANRVGDWVMTGNTTSADLGADNVMVLNGTHVLAREGDPVDLDGNGLFDDDAFIGRGNNTLSAFAGFDLLITDTRNIYAIIQLRDSSGVDINSNPSFGTPDAFVRIAFCPGDVDHNLIVDLNDLTALLSGFGGCAGDARYNPMTDVNDSGCTDLN